MTQPGDFEVNLDELMQKVRRRVDRHKRRQFSDSESTISQGGGLDRIQDIRNLSGKIADGLNLIRRHSRIRTELPRSFNRFPLNRINVLKRAVLKGYELLFREQRTVNNAVADMIGNIHQINQIASGNLARVGGVEAALKVLETRVNELHATPQDDSLAARRARPAKNEAREGQRDSTGPELVNASAMTGRNGLDSLLAALAKETGDRDSGIKEHWLDYLPIILDAEAGTPEHPVLDVGCGRGEWLALLKQKELAARGVDNNRVLVEECNTRGLQAENQDGAYYLQGLPGNSLGAVTGFHIVERLSFETLVRLLDGCVHALKPGGVAIFETLNPDNIMSARGCVDVNLMQPNLLAFPVLKGLAEMRGLTNIEVRFLDTADKPFDSPNGDSHLVDQLNACFGGPRVYAIIGFKP